MDERRAVGLAVACDSEGRITEIVSDGLDLAAHVRAGERLLALFDAACADKVEAFLEELRRRGAVFDWELVTCDADGRLSALHFAGAMKGSGYLVVGAKSRSGVARVYEELLGINNEQPEALRATLKDISLRAREQSGRDADFFEELTRLNNELAAAHRELAKKNAELERLNEQKNQWLGIAAHDLRNPLGVISLYAQFLLDAAEDKLEPDHREFVYRIVRSSRFMLDLVNDLLDVSKIEAGRLELDSVEVDLCELVARNAELNGLLAARKEIAVIYESPLANLRARLDPAKIEQVLNNLVSNAVKFSPRASCVFVRLETGESGHALVTVEDEGLGIPADEIDNLFRPFGRTRVRATEGEKSSGLGLVIAKRIVEGHGGRMRVETAQTGGARFIFTLPVTGEG